MQTILITSEEVTARQMTLEHADAAVKAILTDGFVVLQDVVDLKHLDILHARMVEDVRLLTARKDAPFNWNTGNVQQEPPPIAPYLFRDILLNDMAVAVTKRVLGKGVKNFYYSGNTAVKSTERQPVHADTGHLWPQLDHPHPPVQLVVNIPTVDVSPENGSTELWPGTHLDLTVSIHDDIKVPAAALERRRAEVPPMQPTMKRGSLLIRDIRLWHAGMPNHTDTPRPMIAMIHAPYWFETGKPLRFPKESEAFFADSELTTAATFVEGPIDYLHSPEAYEYQK